MERFELSTPAPKTDKGVVLVVMVCAVACWEFSDQG